MSVRRDADPMAAFDAEADAQEQAPPETSRGGYDRVRVRGTRLAPIDVVGDPEGERGYTTQLGPDEEGAELNVYQKREPAPAPPTPREPSQAELDSAGGMRGYAQRLTDIFLTPFDDGARERTGRRASESWQEYIDSDRAIPQGIVDGATLGWGDEIRAAVRSRLPGRSTYEGELESAREEQRRARDASPTLHAVGTVAGSAPYMALPGPGAGAGALTRILAATGEGAALGGLAGAGGAEEGERLEQGAIGAVLGGGLGALTSGAGEGARAGYRALRGAADGADQALVAAASGASGGRIADRLRVWDQMPGGVSGQAERLRRMGIGTRVGTVQDVLEAAQRGAGEVGEDGAMGAFRSQIEASGRGVPRQSLVDRLLSYADDLQRSPHPEEAALAGRVAERAERFADTLPEEVPYRDALRVLREMGDRTRWQDPASGARLPDEVARGQYRALRGGLDDFAEEILGPEARQAYQQSRLDTQTAMQSVDMISEEMRRAAQRRGISPSDYAAMMAGMGGEGGGGGRAAALGAANRWLRGREATLRARGAELARRIVERTPQRLGEYAQPLLDAMRRGGSALAATHHVLMERDARYRAAMEEFEREASAQGEEQ